MTMRIRWPFALAVAIPASLVACKDSEPQHLDVTVDWSEEHQTIDGFGASSAFFGGNISEEMADQLFDAKKGIGLSLLRVMVGLPDDVKSDGSEPTENAKAEATAPELNTAQQAYARGAKVWATAWTPPPIWKTTNNKNGSGDGYKTNSLKSENYQAYADYLAKFVEYMDQNRVPIIALSPANEPDYIASWDGAQWSGDELATFVAENLGPTFKSRCPKTEIVTPDTASWPNLDKYVPQLMSKAKDYVPIIATHPYTNGSDPVDLHYSKPRDNGKRFWETEWSQENMKGDTPDPTMTSAIDMMNHMHDHLAVANMNAWNWWAIYISPDGLTSGDEKKVRQNPAFIQPDKNMDKSYMFKRAWAFAHWSKFVRPGFKRIGATDHPNPGVLIEAYKDGSSHIALTAINTGNSAVTQKFTIADAPSLGTLTAWVTTDSDDLAAKGTVDGSATFSYDLPPKSVVTFINWDPSKETPNQGDLPVVKADAGSDAQPSSACDNPMVPNNLENGGVTDFSDYTSQKWGNTSGLWGYKYSYAGKNSTMGVDIDAAAKKMHVTGSVVSGDYGGAGISFGVCTTVDSFSQVQFTLSGSSPGCDLELQIKTYDQTPSGSTPGGCVQDNGSCYNYPVKKRVAVPTSDTQTITAALADFSSWSKENAVQVVGVQWQWTGNSELDPDSGVGCPVDVTISNVKFLP
jgi:glucuronoarabinoxylan endo-1,4-beta-xylanase